ncbi:MAG: hypothetical protein SGJ20_22445 [Planctomycetota bacterium]|nr:hypothetical protein [Planctomycetota bacterium]
MKQLIVCLTFLVGLSVQFGCSGDASTDDEGAVAAAPAVNNPPPIKYKVAPPPQVPAPASADTTATDATGTSVAATTGSAGGVQPLAKVGDKNPTLLPGSVYPPIYMPGDINPEWTKPAKGHISGQGRDYGDGYVATVFEAYWSQRDRVGFQIPYEHTMKHYIAANNNKPPKNVAVLIKEILEPAALSLPELPMGEQYMYDPQTGELLVVAKSPETTK